MGRLKFQESKLFDYAGLRSHVEMFGRDLRVRDGTNVKAPMASGES